jgi:hypothetical protein
MALFLFLPLREDQTIAQPTEIASRDLPGSPSSLNQITAEINSLAQRIDLLRSRVASNEGFLRLPGNVIDVLIFDRDQGKRLLTEQLSPKFDGTGTQFDPEMLAPIDRSLDALWSTIDSLAPKLGVPSQASESKGLDNAVSNRLRGTVPDAQFIRALMVADDVGIRTKQTGGLTVSREKRGLVMYKVPSVRYTICREFVYDKPYAGDGVAMSSYDVRFGRLRFQL